MTLCKLSQILRNFVILLHLHTSKFVLEFHLHVSLLFSNNFDSAFHIMNKISFPRRFKKIWSFTPSNIIFLILTTPFFQWEILWASDAQGFATSFLMYSRIPFSSNTTSMLIFHATNFEVPSKAYSSLSLLRAICLVPKKICNTDIQIWTSYNDNLKISTLHWLQLWYHVEIIM